MRPLKQIIPVALLLIAASCGSESPKQQIVFMDSFKVFEEFEMKKDYDALIEQKLGNQQLILDSMAARLNGLSDPLAIARQKKLLYAAQQEFDQHFRELSEQYTNEVYVRLNDYIRAYGKQRGYTLILGADGQGSVMYVDTTANVTADLIRYINSKYTK